MIRESKEETRDKRILKAVLIGSAVYVFPVTSLVVVVGGTAGAYLAFDGFRNVVHKAFGGS